MAPLINAGLLLCVGALGLDSSGQRSVIRSGEGSFMNDGDGFRVVASDLHTHAATVDAAADEIRTAAQAAQAIEGIITAFPWPGAPT